MSVKKIVDENGILTDIAMAEFKKRGNGVSCECPEHLIDLLKSVKEFTAYQDKCLIEKPADVHTHNWLKSTSVCFEHLLSSTIISLARMEGLIDSDNDFIDK